MDWIYRTFQWEVNKMLMCRPVSHRRAKFGFVAVSLLAFALAFMIAPLAAKTKNEVPAPEVKPGDQRVKGYFDISRIVWPNPPAIPRIAFQDLYTGEKVDPNLYVKKGRKSTWMDRLAGTQSVDEIKYDNLPFQLMRTYGVGVDSKGLIYAADQAVGAIFIFDPAKKDHVELIGNGRQASFDMIVDIAMDDDDRLFVSDARQHHVLQFNARHQHEATIGSDVLVRPAGLAIDRENRFLYVVDTGNDVVDVFDADNFKYLRQLGKPSRKHDQTDPGLFSLPEAVAVDRSGNVYVTDTFNNRVEIFDADGEFISTFGKNGDGPADLERPKGIAIDSDGHVWVVDAAQNRIKVFTKEGQLLIYLGGQGNFPGQFMGPWGITIDQSNRVIVSETYPGRVQVFRYITDAQAAAEKARRESAQQKAEEGRASGRQNSSVTMPAASPVEQKQVVPGDPAVAPDAAAKKNSAAN